MQIHFGQNLGQNSPHPDKKVMPSTVEYCHIVNINKALLVTKQKMGEFCCMWHHSLLFIYFTNICGDDSVVKVIIMSAYSV